MNVYQNTDYVSALVKVISGLNTQQHIHEKLIAKAKENLSTTRFGSDRNCIRVEALNIRSHSANFSNVKPASHH